MVQPRSVNNRPLATVRAFGFTNTPEGVLIVLGRLEAAVGRQTFRTSRVAPAMVRRAGRGAGSVRVIGRTDNAILPQSVATERKIAERGP